MLDVPDQSASEYLLESSKGEKFEFTDLSAEDDGPFGGDRYLGVARLPDIDEEIATVNDNLSKSEFGAMNHFVAEVILTFIERVEWPLLWDSSYSFANLLLIATPRDPKGPFTISVYQDYTLCGWLIGQDAEVVACDLVDKYDFGTVVIPIERLENSESGLVFKYKQHILLDVV
jgi:hypothetical protein